MSTEGDFKITARSISAASVWLLAAVGMFALFVWCVSVLPDMTKGNRAVVPYELTRIGVGIAALCATLVLLAQALRATLVPKTHDRPHGR